MKRETLIWTILFVAGGLFIAARAATSGMGVKYVKDDAGMQVTAQPSERVSGIADISWSRTIGTWTAAIFTLCIFSFLYRDNPAYKFAESIVVGVTAAYWMVVGFWAVIVPNLIGKIEPGWIQAWAVPGLSTVRTDNWGYYLIPLVLGIMLLWRLSPTGSWIARWPLAFIIGSTAGIRLIGFIQADFLAQIRNSIVPLMALSSDGSVDVWRSIRSIIRFLSILCCLVYFFFSFEHKGAIGRISKIGIWVLMITFGAAFGYTVMGRIALLAIRLEFLFDEWLWLIDWTGKRTGL